jgi:hypothetical protein
MATAPALRAVLLCVILAGCSFISSDSGGTESDREVRLAAAPTPGMRVSYRVRTTATLSGVGVRFLTESQKMAATSQRYAVEVTSIEATSFNVRITGDSLQGAVIARFGKDWTAQKFGIENEGKYSDADFVSFPILGEAFQVARNLAGKWTVGETRPWERTMTLPPLVSVKMLGKTTFKRVTKLAGRRVAEFDYSATGDGEYAASALQMKLAGLYWVDLVTGFMVESKTTATGQFTQSGEPIQMELKEERTLNRTDSVGI